MISTILKSNPCIQCAQSPLNGIHMHPGNLPAVRNEVWRTKTFLGVRNRSLTWLIFISVALLLLLAACGTAPATPPIANTTPVPQPTVHPPVVYVAMGASDAVGVGANNPATQGYVPRIIARLPAHSQALNLGISGITLHDALQQELPQVAPEHPTLITVWLVGNDFRDCVPLDQYSADLNTLLTDLHNQTSAQVFVANLPDMSELPSFQRGAPGAGACLANKPMPAVRQMAEQWNAVIAKSVSQHGDVLVNLFNSDLLAHPDYISPTDGFHPSSQGYARLADLFWMEIVAHHAVPSP